MASAVPLLRFLTAGVVAVVRVVCPNEASAVVLAQPTGRIVYAVNEGGHGAIGIYAINADGSKKDRLNKGYDDKPVWSPNGDRISFSDTDGSRIGVMNADGSHKSWIPAYAEDNGAWLPDGKRVLFVGGTLFNTSVNGGQASGRNAGPTIANGSGNVRKLASDQTRIGIALSPDGKQVAYPTDTSIKVVNTGARQGGRTILRTSSPWHLAWSPDGRSIAFLNATAYLWVIDLKSRTARRVTHDDCLPCDTPRWSPDGRRILFVESNDIYSVRSDGSDRKRLTRYGEQGVARRSPQWSPDGHFIAFGGPGYADLWLMRSDGSDQHRLTHDGLPIDDPDWTSG